MKFKAKKPRPPRAVGADVEMGNSITGLIRRNGTGADASSMLLKYIRGVPGSAYLATGASQNPQDIGRKWLQNGSCCYIDLDHLEIALPETGSAWEFTAALHAQFKIVEHARERAEAQLPEGQDLHVFACNSDGSGSSWGSHQNFLISRECYDRIFSKRLDCLLWLASYQASACIVSGQGKVGAENGASPVAYQLSQRADFTSEVVALQTTFNRPIINSRDEALCFGNKGLARFHHISADVNLCHTANVLKVGILQILLDMIEVDSPLIQSDLILKEPVAAFTTYSHDPALRAACPNLNGVLLGALDLQFRFLEAASAFVSSGECDETVPRAAEIIALWSDTLEKLRQNDWDALSRRLDWVLKRAILEDVMLESPNLNWESPEVKHLDLVYGSLNPVDGLYLALEAAGAVDLLVDAAQIERAVTTPPSRTRAYTRGHLLRLFGRDSITFVDWDRIGIRYPPKSYYSRTKIVQLDNPAEDTRAENGWMFNLKHPVSPQTILNHLDSLPPANPAGEIRRVEPQQYTAYPNTNTYGTPGGRY